MVDIVTFDSKDKNYMVYHKSADIKEHSDFLSEMCRFFEDLGLMDNMSIHCFIKPDFKSAEELKEADPYFRKYDVACYD